MASEEQVVLDETVLLEDLQQEALDVFKQVNFDCIELITFQRSQFEAKLALFPEFVVNNLWEVVSEWRTLNDLDFNFTIEDGIDSDQINSESEATSPSQRAISPIETPAGCSGKDGTDLVVPGQNGLANSNTDPVESIPSLSGSCATNSSRNAILPIKTPVGGAGTSRIAVLSNAKETDLVAAGQTGLANSNTGSVGSIPSLSGSCEIGK
ncbi:hypothetical protein quinque_007027 [Culex quinquefasciatus]|uniref:uncharacterized protein LOC119765980 n=1 Tax=Culex quinquefasciatus TaxID=7176 RepID=UPI0018E35231|nr:uncharacterized protein LOC119765980 [Culex quinquefasciatus]